MTKQQRKEIYWAAMFVAYAEGVLPFVAMDIVLGRTAYLHDFLELCVNGISDPLERLSKAIDLCEQ